MKYTGLTTPEVVTIRKKYGQNTLPEEKPYRVLSLLLMQTKSPLIYILLLVAAISLFFGENLDAVLMILVVTLNVVMGFIQEYGAQKTLYALRKVIKPTSTVIRNGSKVTIDSAELVPGDIVFFGTGDTISADGQLLEGVDILVNEAILTGESEPVKKTLSPTNNFVYMGSNVIAGRGVFQVTSTGTKTEVGKIGKSLSVIKEISTPLQQKLNHFSRTLVLLIVSVSCMIFLIGLLKGQELFYIFRYSIILAISAIPEGLPVAITVILAIGMKRILKNKGLIRKLASVETLGSVSVICTDKTGTLTEGVMKVTRTSFTNHREALVGLAMLNSQRTGLEVAIWEYLKKELGYDPQKLVDKITVLHEDAFDSGKKYAKSVIQTNKTNKSYIIGAPEMILSFCSLKKPRLKQILAELDRWTMSGLRVVGLAFKYSNRHSGNKNYSWGGLIGVHDPVRKTVSASIEEAIKAGIKIKIVTGDHAQTALKVAQKVGLVVQPENILDGDQLSKISPMELKNKIDSIVLFARVQPIQKLKIIEALQERGEVVAMTGDGVNDAPSLKKADIGIAVGSATDVAKAASDLILLDNNFTTIVSAVEEGRTIFANIKKLAAYVLSNSFAEMVLIIGAILLGLPAPLTVVQILWLHLICDGPPDIVLGFEPKEADVMKEKPKSLIKENILDFSMIFLIFIISLTTGGLGLFAFAQGLRQHNINAQTIAFAVLGTIDLIYLFSYKDLKKPLIKINIFNNKYLILSVIYGFVLLLSGVYLPQINQLLDTHPLKIGQWLYAGLAGLLAVIWVELVKMFRLGLAQSRQS